MTVRLDTAARRKVERLAAREGISLKEALNRCSSARRIEVSACPDAGATGFRPRKVAFGFDIARAKRLAGEMSDGEALGRRKSHR